MGRRYLPELTPIYIGGLLDNSEAFEKAWEDSGKDRLWFVVDVASFNVFDANENVRSWIRHRGHLVQTLACLFTGERQDDSYLSVGIEHDPIACKIF